ncbi:MAG: OsmC family peroxiredoxin [Bacteroidetes bacterium]|nr:OsmC family peroxiredoxin [Bacteroidota bacterium]HET6244568.1 OsmC family peroxiredoxin [Bacteroidia bacterium]
MPTRKASAQWSGDLKQGSGKITTGGVIKNAEYTFTSRFEDGVGTNPEELLGSAHAACFSMELASKLSADGYSVDTINTSDSIHLEKNGNGFSISKIVINCEAKVQGINKEEFLKYAENAKNNCIISKALTGVNMELETVLK